MLTLQATGQRIEVAKLYLNAILKNAYMGYIEVQAGKSKPARFSQYLQNRLAIAIEKRDSMVGAPTGGASTGGASTGGGVMAMVCT